MKRMNGFTLIELLVVIAIIAILAAILFPVFVKAKAKGQQAACASNMKQMGVALQIYIGDWDDSYPMNRFRDPLMSPSAAPDGTRFNWKTAIRPYMKTKGDVWACPSNIMLSDRLPDKRIDETGKAFDAATWHASAYPRSYALNGAFFNSYIPNTYTLTLIKAGTIKKASKLIFILESRFDAPDLTLGQLDTRLGNCWCRAGKGWIQTHVGASSNFLFADTHMANMKITRTMVPEQMWYDMGGRDADDNPQSDYDTLATKLPPDCY